MQPAQLNSLLEPFLREPLDDGQLKSISMYIDILIRWNARLNLTSIRTPEEIVTRHFGESLFAAQHLFDRGDISHKARVLDVGSGAGFPGLPIKLWAPHTHVTLIESNHKKVTFLREVIRTLTLTDVDVFPERAEDFPSSAGNVVALRAVERFATILPVAASLLAAQSRLALFIGSAQLDQARAILPSVTWAEPIPLPASVARSLLIGTSTART